MLYVDPRTYAPIKLVINRLALLLTSQTWAVYRTLPITAADVRLLSLAARHPQARIDHSRGDDLRAAGGLIVFTG